MGQKAFWLLLRTKGDAMRMVMCCFFAAMSFNLSLKADDKKEEKIDGAKLVGKWKSAEKKGEYPLMLEFRKDGTMTAKLTIKEDTYSLPHTYKVDGNKVVIVMIENVMHDQVYIINKLTDTELVWTAEKNKEKSTLTRLNDK